jgi:kynurenine formamidase
MNSIFFNISDMIAIKKRGKIIKDALAKIGYQLKPMDIVLIRTDASKRFDETGYENVNPGVSEEATLWLIQQGIKVMGIDAWGWDRSLGAMIDDLKAGNKEQFWESHYLGKEIEYCHMERLCNLDKIPRPYGFKVAAFPIKIEGASAGWVRAVAILS